MQHALVSDTSEQHVAERHVRSRITPLEIPAPLGSIQRYGYSPFYRS